ncbi:hypothetical protein ACF06W_11450 [Streptomyces albus]|uniref:hypothetical protein n=1 Tax=Streptomyces albus TaxID=1888 RepID=UPI0036FD630C
MLIRITRCQRAWPRCYTTYHQETEPPYRRADSALVVRLGTVGLVVGRWTSRAEDEQQALTEALGARPAALLTSEGHLLPNYCRNLSEAPTCSPDDPPKTSSSSRPEGV